MQPFYNKRSELHIFSDGNEINLNFGFVISDYHSALTQI